MVRASSTARFLVALVAAAIAAPAFFTLSLRALLYPSEILTSDFWARTFAYSIATVTFGGLGAFVILGICYGWALNQNSPRKVDIFFASFIAALLHSIVGFVMGSVSGGAAMLLGFYFEFAALLDHLPATYGWVLAAKVVGGLAAGALFLSVLAMRSSE